MSIHDLRLSLLVALVALSFSCGGAGFTSDGGVASFAGTYSGTYTTLLDHGAIVMEVASDGKVNLTATSANSSTMFSGSGMIDATGAVSAAGIGTGGGLSFTFTGKFTTATHLSGKFQTSTGASGSWEVDRISASGAADMSADAAGRAGADM